MKKNLLIAIALALAFSAFWSCTDFGYNPAENPNNYAVYFQVNSPLLQVKGKESATGQSIMGFWGYPKDSIKFRKFGTSLYTGQVSVDNSGLVIFYFVEEPWADLMHDATYSKTLYITYPMSNKVQLPYGGQTDSVKCQYHIIVRKGTPKIDDLKIYYNDSLYALAGTYQFIKN
jgi:hypothetical protein